MDITSLLQSGYHHPLLRKWQATELKSLSKDALIYPVFIHDKPDTIEPILSMPNQSRYGVNTIVKVFKPLVCAGLKSILIFGVTSEKDIDATSADSESGPTIQAIKIFRNAFPDLLIACDVCMCPFTVNGHCGYIDETTGCIKNEPSIQRLAQISLNYAMAGCHVIAPSDMMDGRIGAIKKLLSLNGLANRVSVMSYSAKV